MSCAAPSHAGGEGDGETAALGPADASDRAGMVTELSAGALQAPWLLSLRGRFLWNEAGGERGHRAINMHQAVQSKPIKRVKKKTPAKLSMEQFGRDC